jgi:hypothetical protein
MSNVPARERNKGQEPGRVKSNKPLIRKTMIRALEATPEQLDEYIYDQIDFLCAEAMMNGERTYLNIANAVGMSYEAIKRRMRNPVRCAWISQQMTKIIPQRLGQVYAALYARAIEGDARAATMVLERFDPLFSPKTNAGITVNAGGDVNITKLSDEEISARIQELVTETGQGGKIIDVEADEITESEGTAPEAAAGEGPAAEDVPT